MGNKLEDVSKQVKVAASKKADKELDEIFDALGEEEPNKRIDANTFSKKFLPFLKGEKKISEDKDILNDWIGVAGGHHNELDVINNKGEVIVTIPPLLSTPDNLADSDMNKLDLIGLQKTYTTAVKAGDGAMANVSLVQSLDVITNIIDKEVPKIEPSLLDKLIDIDNVHPNIKKNIEAGKVDKSKPTISDDEIEYD